MDSTILTSLITLLPMVCVIILVACLLTRSRGQGLMEIIVAILAEVHAFSGEYPQSDDITLMVVKVM